MAIRVARNSESEESLAKRAASFPDYPTLESLDAESLRQITRREDNDFATALLFDRFQKSPRYAGFIQRINTLRQSALKVPQRTDAKVVIVPGALYVERPDLGGNGSSVREVAESCGWYTDLIPLASRGSVTENARRLNDWLRRHSDKKIVLVSLSKGGADLKMALAAPEAPELFKNVVAWINVCGPLTGSRMVDWVLSSRIRTWLLRLQYRLQRRDFQFITELRHDANAPLDFPLHQPAGMRMISLIGFPLWRHMTTPFSRFCHRILSREGPNDGTVSLSDLLVWPGEIYPTWGMDHYFRDENTARNLVAATLNYLAEESATTRPEEFKCFSNNNPQRIA